MNSIVSFEWFPNYSVNLQIDNVFLILSGLVVFITILVALFSLEYMKGDQRKSQYFLYLTIFMLSMIGLLIADHLLLLFVFWELVGFSSYLLIGFWYQKEGVSQSQRMAFMVNRIADVCLFCGILILSKSSSLNISEVESIAYLPGLLIALGAFGKSAQLPFSGWLTKAMVGPTPISALIHAATMVAAGVYLLFRVAPVLDQSVLLFVAIVGSITAFYGGLSALNQTDIKKVLAYSTISQLGYMMIGIGVEARDMALFHLWTHAFFKAGLFLSAGSIIHFIHLQKPDVDAQDMRNMGGLRKVIPFTFIAFSVCAASLVGLPLFSGFLSKEGIIAGAFQFASEMGGISYLIPVLAFVTVFLTAFYVLRTLLLVFFDKPKFEFKTYTESIAFKVPLVILSILSVWIVHSFNPFGHEWNLGIMLYSEVSHHSSIIVTIASLILILAGTWFSKKNLKSEWGEGIFNKLFLNGFFLTSGYQSFGQMTAKAAFLIQRFDKKILDWSVNGFAISMIVFAKALAIFDRFVIDGPINLSAEFSKFMGKCFAALSSRQIQRQLSYLLIGLILILVWILF